MKINIKEISLCFINRNGAGFLPKSLQPLAGLVGEVIFNDTGSDDESVELASSYGAKVIRTIWEDDFSKARNSYLEYAKLPWILAIDSDEILFPDDLLKLIDELDFSKKSGIWFTVHHYSNDTGKINWTYGLPHPKLKINVNGYSKTRNIKLFPNYYGLSYRYPLHESILPDLLEHDIPIIDTSVVIHHLGLLNSDINSKKKRLERNLCLGFKKIKQYPDIACGYIELADLIIEYGNPETAIKLLQQAVSLAPGYSDAYYRLANAYENNNQIEHALIIYKKLLEAEPDNPLYNSSVGRLIYEQGNYKEAEYFLSHAKDYFSVVRLALVLHYLGKYSEALQAANKAVSINPDRYEAKIVLKRFELDGNKFSQANKNTNLFL